MKITRKFLRWCPRVAKVAIYQSFLYYSENQKLGNFEQKKMKT
jgi:hypothetical protein